MTETQLCDNAMAEPGRESVTVMYVSTLYARGVLKKEGIFLPKRYIIRNLYQKVAHTQEIIS